MCRFTLNRQPGKALPYFLRLRRPNVFQLIRENNLFTDVQDQALLLVEFDQELREKRRQEGEDVDTDPVSAITLLVDHIHSIPVEQVYTMSTCGGLTLARRRLAASSNNCSRDRRTYICIWTRYFTKTHISPPRTRTLR